MEIRGATAWSQTIPCIGDSMPFTTWLDGFLYAGKNTNHNCEVMDKFSLLGPCNSVACMRAFGVWLNSGSVVTKLRKYVVRTYLFFGICWRWFDVSVHEYHFGPIEYVNNRFYFRFCQCCLYLARLWMNRLRKPILDFFRIDIHFAFFFSLTYRLLGPHPIFIKYKLQMQRKSTKKIIQILSSRLSANDSMKPHTPINQLPPKPF